jgi:hypothetical protein
MSMRALGIALFSVLVAAPVGAVEVYINGQKVTGGVRDTNFEKVDVRFDANGNVLIDAPGYQIQVTDLGSAGAPGSVPGVGAGVGAAPGMAPGRVPGSGPSVSAGMGATPGVVGSYPGGVPGRSMAAPSGEQVWVVVNNKMPGHYKMLIQVNGTQVADIPAVSPQFISNVSDRMRPGVNTVQITYLPMPTAPMAPVADAVEVMIGRGVTGADGTLTIGRVLGTHKQRSGNPSADAATLTFTLE